MGYLPGGCTCPRGCTCLGAGGVPAQGVYLPGGVPARGCTCPGVYLPRGGVPAWGVYLPRYSPPWTEFLTHASENITLPHTSFAGGQKFYSYKIICGPVRSECSSCTVLQCVKLVWWVARPPTHIIIKTLCRMVSRFVKCYKSQINPKQIQFDNSFKLTNSKSCCFSVSAILHSKMLEIWLNWWSYAMTYLRNFLSIYLLMFEYIACIVIQTIHDSW